MEPCRIIFHTVFLLFFAIATLIFTKSVLFRMKLVFSGRPARGKEDYSNNPLLGTRLLSFFENVIFQKKNFKRPLRGIMHSFIFYGFIAYMPHTLSQILVGLFGWGAENPYSVSLVSSLLGSGGAQIYETLLEIASILVLTGLGFFAARRWIFRSPGLDFDSLPSFIVIAMISILMITTLLGMGAGAISTSPYFNQHSGPVSTFIGALLENSGLI